MNALKRALLIALVIGAASGTAYAASVIPAKAATRPGARAVRMIHVSGQASTAWFSLRTQSWSMAEREV